MSTDPRKAVAVVFGGVSPEHEVSVISAHQVLAAMDTTRFMPVPVYVAKDGQWYVGKDLGRLDAFKDLERLRSRSTRVAVAPGAFGQIILAPVRRRTLFGRKGQSVAIDVVLLAFHGGAGENGGMQGLCESLGVPYTGSGVLASAVGMDKVVSKQLCRETGIPVVDYLGLTEREWAGSEEEWLTTAERQIGYPIIVKPARLGSSIGIEVANDRKSLDRTIEGAFRFDSKVVLERAVRNLTEINCSVLGCSESVRLSVLEQPVRSESDQFLTYADKYQRSGERAGIKSAGSKGRIAEATGMASLDRIIPAPLSAERTAEVRGIAERVFRLFDCSGVVRIDFLIDEDDGTIYFNEINTIPGSFSFYLWDPAGIDFTALVTDLIEIALRRHREGNARVRSYDVNLLSERSLGGLKGAKAETPG